MEKPSRLLETIPNFILFFLFAASMLVTLLFGARIYQNVSAVMDRQYSITTCINYMTAKVRHYDRSDGITKGNLGEADALILNDTFSNQAYTTYLYSYDGYLMELFCSADMEFAPEDGQRIMPLDTLEVQLKDGFLLVACAIGEDSEEMVLSLQSGREANFHES